MNRRRRGRRPGVAIVSIALSVSVDGFVAGPGEGPRRTSRGGGDALLAWMGAGAQGAVAR